MDPRQKNTNLPPADHRLESFPPAERSTNAGDALALQALGKALETLKKERDNLQSRSDRLSNRVDQLEAIKSELQEGLATLERENRALVAKSEQFTSDIGNLQRSMRREELESRKLLEKSEKNAAASDAALSELLDGLLSFCQEFGLTPLRGKLKGSLQLSPTERGKILSAALAEELRARSEKIHRLRRTVLDLKGQLEQLQGEAAELRTAMDKLGSANETLRLESAAALKQRDVATERVAKVSEELAVERERTAELRSKLASVRVKGKDRAAPRTASQLTRAQGKNFSTGAVLKWFDERAVKEQQQFFSKLIQDASGVAIVSAWSGTLQRALDAEYSKLKDTSTTIPNRIVRIEQARELLASHVARAIEHAQRYDVFFSLGGDAQSIVADKVSADFFRVCLGMIVAGKSWNVTPVLSRVQSEIRGWPVNSRTAFIESLSDAQQRTSLFLDVAALSNFFIVNQKELDALPADSDRIEFFHEHASRHVIDDLNVILGGTDQTVQTLMADIDARGELLYRQLSYHPAHLATVLRSYMG